MKNFLLHVLSKHLHRFRCGGKGEHLNLTTRQNPAAKPLTTNALQDFLKLHTRFRSQTGLEHRRMQMHSGGTSGRGIRQTRNKTAQASEPEQNSKNQPQFIDKLSIARFKQASPPVQMQWKRRASEPYHKTESGSQTANNKRIARFFETAHEVQMLTGLGTPQNANAHWRHFWQGYPPNTQQNSPGI